MSLNLFFWAEIVYIHKNSIPGLTYWFKSKSILGERNEKTIIYSWYCVGLFQFRLEIFYFLEALESFKLVLQSDVGIRDFVCLCRSPRKPYFYQHLIVFR